VASPPRPIYTTPGDATDLSDRSLRRALNQTKRQLSENRGLLCFSESWSNPVQWSHYADSHRGICLGFEVPARLLRKVTYQDERLAYNGKLDEAQMLEVLSTKFSHWAYEQEHRLFLSLDPGEAENGLYFADFTEDLRLTFVIVGCESIISRADIVEALGEHAVGVEVYKARPAFRSFEVVRNKNEDLWK
jgi:hypothetical protein